MRVGRLFQFFYFVCSICNSWRSHAGTGCESRGARGWDAWRVAAALPPCCLLAFPFPSLPFPPSQHVFLFGSGGTGDQTRAANMSLSLAPAPSAGHGLKEATLQARVYLHNVLYYTIRGGKGRAVTGRRRRRRRRRRRNSALRVYFEMQANRARVWRTRWPTRQCTWAGQGSERLKRQ